MHAFASIVHSDLSDDLTVCVEVFSFPYRSSLNWFNQEDVTASVWKCFNFSPRSSLLVNREGPFSGCYWVTSLEWPQIEWHSIGPEQYMKLIINCHRLIFRSSIFINCSGPAFKKNYTNKQKKIKWTAAPSNNFFKILVGIIENFPYSNVCLCRIVMNACNNNKNNNFISVPHSDLHDTKNRYKYGESTGCP